jgi:hypothetical protein
VMAIPTLLISTWGDGLFVVTGQSKRQAFANLPVRGLASDGRGGALFIVGGHSLYRRTPDGAFSTLATSELDLACCMAVGDAIYVGTDNARLLRLAGNSRPGSPLSISTMTSTTCAPILHALTSSPLQPQAGCVSPATAEQH